MQRLNPDYAASTKRVSTHDVPTRPTQPKVQEWDQSVAVGQQAVQAVVEFLQHPQIKQRWMNTQLVHSVEDDPRYQPLGIDLLWVVPEQSFLRCMTIEVKGDRYDRTGNFFFETVSDLQRNTGGAVVITRSEWLFYYFVNSGVLYCLPMAQVKPWFLANLPRFRERVAQSRRGGSQWRTAGRLVPIATVLREIPAVSCFRKEGEQWIKGN
ncbi:MAG: hypothetical protein R3C14_16615 [Caldilineaceae bacterium]